MLMVVLFSGAWLVSQERGGHMESCGGGSVVIGVAVMVSRGWPAAAEKGSLCCVCVYVRFILCLCV